jgi:hypothetical protein
LQRTEIIGIRQTGNSRFAVVRNFQTAITLMRVVPATFGKVFDIDLFTSHSLLYESVLDGIDYIALV